MTLRDRRSIVAIDPTPRGVAYVCFARGELLDWGHRHCGRNESDVGAFIEELLTFSDADVLLLEATASPASKRCTRIRKLLALITRRAQQKGIVVRAVSRSAVRAHWTKKGVTTKEAVAAAIAHQLPELQPFVPPPRKIWMSENPHVNLFDAASLVLCRFGLSKPVR